MSYYTAVAPPTEVVQEMDNLLLSEGEGYIVKAVPNSELERFTEYLQVWGNMRGVYTYITHEMVEWCREQIGGKSAIEIGVGHGTLYRELGIKGTDAFQQVDDKLRMANMVALGQVPTQPARDVIKHEALEAVKVLKPQVVIGCFITNFISMSELLRGIPGNLEGVREQKILERVEKYIHFGNLNVHGDKKILRFPHKTYRFPWHHTRAKDPSLNVIHVWEGKLKN